MSFASNYIVILKRAVLLILKLRNWFVKGVLLRWI